MTKQKLLYNDPKAAEYKTVEGWVSANGMFWGNDEHMARWSACTHMVCECGNEHEKGRTRCKECCKKISDERFQALPFKEWDGETPLTLFDSDEYFFSECDLEHYCDVHDISASTLQLQICDPVYFPEIDYDSHFCDELPEDNTVSDIDPELAAMLDKVNKHIRESKKVSSWYGGKYRTSYEYSPDSEAA